MTVFPLLRYSKHVRSTSRGFGAPSRQKDGQAVKKETERKIRESERERHFSNKKALRKFPERTERVARLNLFHLLLWERKDVGEISGKAGTVEASELCCCWSGVDRGVAVRVIKIPTAKARGMFYLAEVG